MQTLENFQTTKGSDAFPWAECELPEQLGCTREKIAALRKSLLARDTGFAIVKGRICWSGDGLLTVLAALGLPEVEKPALKPVLEFRVHRGRTLNSNIITATDGQRVVRVRVKSKENFRPGMLVRCTLIDGDLYQLEGRCPRFSGKY